MSELEFKETEFDLLEQYLVTLSSVHEIYGAVAGWLIRKMSPIFILFSADIPGTISHRQYFIRRKGEEFSVPKCLQERKSAGVGAHSVFLHQSGCVSLPYMPAYEVTGCMYIGPRSGKSAAYTEKDIKKLLPVVRILNKALLYFAATRSADERNRLKDAFSHYVSPDIVQDILHNPDVIHLGGEKKFLTCVFTDLQGFTSLSDTMDPIVLVRVLNMYLNEMSQVIIALGGTIDKYEGDAIMAFFGAPHELKDHAVRCCLAALRMKRMEDVLNEQLIHEKLIEKPLFTRIGINSGDMVVGNVGSMQRLDYTIIGSNVNIASRIENANKEYNTSILISGATYSIVKDYFDCENLGYVLLRGVRKPVEIYRLDGLKKGVVLDYENFKNAEDVNELQEA